MMGYSSTSQATVLVTSCYPQSECSTLIKGYSLRCLRSISWASGSILAKYPESMAKKADWRLRVCVSVRMVRLLQGSLGKSQAIRGSLLVLIWIIIFLRAYHYFRGWNHQNVLFIASTKKVIFVQDKHIRSHGDAQKLQENLILLVCSSVFFLLWNVNLNDLYALHILHVHRFAD